MPVGLAAFNVKTSLNYLVETENVIITNFEKFNLTSELMSALSDMSFQNPSPVQDAAIDSIMGGNDVLVQAPTGTGKTAAFAIPLVEKICPQDSRIQAVILCPTRELALQTTGVLQQLSKHKPAIRTLALYGGEPIWRQIGELKRRPQIIVATPGRLLDHINRQTMRLSHVQCVVLDEADRMLDMGFREDISTILDGMPAGRQTILFSATLSAGIKKIAAEYQSNAHHISIAQDKTAVERVQQFYSEIRSSQKTPALLQLLKEKQFGLSLIFVATKAMADTLAQQLTTEGHPADALHGGLQQSQRDKVMQRYRTGKTNILVATDVAARGIDVDGINAVINYDIPGDSDSYVHRIGRTGRANGSGVAYTFIYSRERGKLRDIITGAKATILPAQLESGLFLSPVLSNGGRVFSGKPYGRSRSGNGSYGHRRSYNRAGA
ncbi:MAG: hypothetical protein ABT01_04980 [Clostridium sp. SCN 57-10]|nr:MAG: hypothetical protein ABT01_04980 [Clostridium sp. SCN 57-10]